MPSPTNQSYCQDVPSIMNSKAFDLGSLSGLNDDFYDVEECFDGYTTPPTMAAYADFPPKLILKSAYVVNVDFDSFDSDLLIPVPKHSFEDDVDCATTLFPRFRAVDSENIPTEALSLPSLGDVTSDNEEDDGDGDSVGCSKKLEIMSVSPLSEISQLDMGYESLPEKEPLRKKPFSTNHPLDLSTTRRKSLGAFAA